MITQTSAKKNSKTELQLLKEVQIKRLEQALARKDFKAYVAYTMPEFQFEWYHDKLFDALAKVETGEVKKLMVFMHPRIGKSEIVSKRFPAYILGKYPKKKILCASKSSGMATTFGRQTRSIVKREEYLEIFPEFKLADDKSEAGNWETKEEGGYFSAGVGSQIMGRGMNFGIIDDPIGSEQDVATPEQREKMMEWYKGEFLTRRDMADYAIVLMHQRWSSEDLAGQLIEEEKEDWTILSFPAIDNSGNPLSTKRGFNLEAYERLRKEMGVKQFAAKYQQDPIAAGGNIFKEEDFRYKYLSDLKKEDFTVSISVDPAFSTNKASDDVGIIVTARHKTTKEIYVLDCMAQQLSVSESYSYILSLAEKWKDWTLEYISIEEATISKDQQDFLNGFEKYMREQGKFYTLLTMNPRGKGKKEDRIKISLEPMFNRHAIYFLGEHKQERDWMKLREQLLKFPTSRKDDIMDALSQAVIMWETRQSGTDDEYEKELALLLRT